MQVNASYLPEKKTTSKKLTSLPKLKCFFVIRFCGNKVIVHVGMQEVKGRTRLGVFVPTAEHRLIEGVRTVGHLGHSVTSLDLLEYFCISHTYENNRQEGEKFKLLMSTVPVSKGFFRILEHKCLGRSHC